MIRQEKYQNALHALSSILTRARWMAHESKATDLAELLDAAEILPKYIGQSDDATEDFRAAIEDISLRYENCAHIVEDFRQDCTCLW